MKRSKLLTIAIALMLLSVILAGCTTPEALAPLPASEPVTVPTPTPTPPVPAPSPALTPPAEFEVITLEVDSDEIAAGESFNITAKLSNKGGFEGIYTASPKVDGEEVDSKEIKLAAGSTDEISFPMTLEDTGTSTLEVGGTSSIIKVLRTAELTVTDISISPLNVFPGEEAIIKASVVNWGKVKGFLTPTLYVDGVEVDSRPLSLEPYVTENITFSLIKDVPGDYQIDISGSLFSNKLVTVLKVLDVETYNNEQYYFSVLYPRGWGIKEYDGGIVIQKLRLSPLLKL